MSLFESESDRAGWWGYQEELLWRSLRCKIEQKDCEEREVYM